MKRFIGALNLLAIGSLCLALLSQTNAEGRERDRANALLRHYEGTERAADLIGRHLPREVLALEKVRSSGRLHYFWFVNPEECGECLKQVKPWNSLAESGLVGSTLILHGNDQRLLKLSEKGLESSAPINLHVGNLIEESLGYPFPSLRIVTDEQGVVLLADSRIPGPKCDWIFETVLFGLLGRGEVTVN